MDWLQLIVLSLLQGVTEFLPVSSSAHLILPAQLFGWQDQGQAFDVAVHVGTLLAVLIALRAEVLTIAHGWSRQVFKQQPSNEARLGWLIILATLPAGLLGLICEDMIEDYTRSTLVIGLSTIVFGLVLWWADARGRRDRPEQTLGWRAALTIGLAQALALIPGTSRSGITMTAALMLGFDRQFSARFSFLLSIPLILAAGLLKTVELAEVGTQGQWTDILIGTLLSFLSALACIKLFLAALDRMGMLPFVLYRLALGVVLLLFFV